MRTTRTALSALLTLFLVAGCQPAGEDEAEGETAADRTVADRAAADRAALRSTASEFVAAYDAGDARRVASFFAPRGRLLLPDGAAVEGDSAIQAFYRKSFGATESRSLKISGSSPTVHGDTAYDHGSYSIVAVRNTGDTLRATGHYSNALVRTPDGGWKMLWHMVTGPTLVRPDR